MTRDDLIRLAREACDTDKVDAWHNGFWTVTQEELERFAALVAAEKDAEIERLRTAIIEHNARPATQWAALEITLPERRPKP